MIQDSVEKIKQKYPGATKIGSLIDLAFR